MFRALASRRILGLAVVAAAGTGIGVGAATLWPSSASGTPQVARAQAAEPSAVLPAPVQAGAPAGAESPDTAGAAEPTGAPTTAAVARLTLDQAEALAARVAAGRVVEADQDVEDTGTQYDVKVLRQDGSVTDVQIDAATGRVLSTKTDDGN
jgi:hypothetical protein